MDLINLYGIKLNNTWLCYSIRGVLFINMYGITSNPTILDMRYTEMDISHIIVKVL